MLDNFFSSLSTRCSPYLRHMGYLDEALAMRGRYSRFRTFWQPHLENTRRFILSSAKRCRTRQRAVVLGSGLLLDLPLQELSSLFKEVLLIDVICLPKISNEIKRYGNVTFMERDVANVAQRLYQSRQNGSHELPEAARPCLNEYGNADLVISLNILSQLWVIPRIFAVKPAPTVSVEKLDDWCRRIVEAHHEFLLNMSCRVCMIADIEFMKRDRDGRIFSRGSTVFGLPLPEPDETWTWDIEPIQTKSQFHSRELIVGAWHLR
jgi:hypothetical protein